MRNGTGSARAFTLMELLTVIVILSLASAAVVPVFMGNTARYRLRDAVTRLADTMRFCQSMAVFEGRGFRLHIEREKNACWVAFEKDPVESPQQFVEYRASGYSMYPLPEGIFFWDLTREEDIEAEQTPETEEQGEFIEFRGDGTASRTIIVIGNEKEEYFSIAVSSLTGSVRVIEGNILAEGEEGKDEG